MRLATSDLSKPEDVERLYRLAVQFGCCVASEANRQHVFEQAALDVRLMRTSPTYLNRSGVRVPRVAKAIFRENVPNQRWWATCGDADEARRLIAIANRIVPATTTEGEAARLRKEAELMDIEKKIAKRTANAILETVR